MVNDLIKLLPNEYQNLRCFIFNSEVSLEERKARILKYFENSFEESNIIKNIDGHSTHSCIVHFINLDERLIRTKYSTSEEQRLHTVELFFHECHHAYQVTYEGEIDTEVNIINHPLEIAADKFAKEQMISNKGELSKLLGIKEERIEQFANDIRKNKGADDYQPIKSSVD